jgi:hypothetical protein
MPAPYRPRALAPMCLAAFTVVAGGANAQIAFTDVTVAAKVNRAGESYGASWGDLNGDAYLDIFASNHRQQPSLYLNLGNGTFFETAPQVLTWRNRPRADTHGGSWADFDGDGDQDLLVSAGTGNLSQLLVNEHQRLVDRTVARGLTTSNLGGRLPVWLDYDGDGLTDFVMTQFGGIAKLYRQGPRGQFTETTSEARLLCIRFHYGQLIDINNDGRLDLLCSDETLFPQKVYDTRPLPWKKIYDSSKPAPYLPGVPQATDSAIADFDNDGRMDLFVIGRVQLRQSGVSQSNPTHFEAAFMNGIKGFRFVSAGKVTFDMDWNKQDTRTTTDFRRIQIGAGALKPKGLPFTLDPTNPAVRGMPPRPTKQEQIPVMQIGYNATTRQWTLILWTQLSETSPGVFSEAYVKVDSTAAITGLAATGLWPSDRPQKPTLLMNRSGGFLDETVRANLDVPMECVSVTAGDFDNDMDVDLYFTCRKAAANIANLLYENLGDGSFRKVAGAGGAEGPVGVSVASGAGSGDMAVVGDYDVDGFLDLFVTNGFSLRPLQFGGPNRLFRNRGNGKRWIEIDLVGQPTEREATGTRVFVTANGVRQLREQNGAYHRWSQDSKRLHFGLASASTATVRIEWPNGTVQTFNNVASNRLYRATQGGTLAAVTPGGAPPYQCGPPSIKAGVDRGLFIWRDCPTGEWRLKTAAGGGSAIHAGTITSTAAFNNVKGVGLNAADSLTRPNATTIRFRLDTRGKATDGINFVPKDTVSACLKVDTPARLQVFYGPFRKPLSTPLDLDTRKACK